MRAKLLAIVLAVLSLPLVGANSRGPVRLLSCVVSSTGLLEAEVDNAAESAQTCNLRCDYVIREATISHGFEVTIPARFSGRVGQFDTSSGRPGNYSGSVGTCRGFSTNAATLRRLDSLERSVAALEAETRNQFDQVVPPPRRN